MMSKLPFRVVVQLAICFCLSCAGKSGPASSAATVPDEAGGLNELSAVTVEDRGNQSAILVNGSQPMSPNVFQLTDPHRIIVDLTNTTLGEVNDLITVGSSGIDEITLDQFDDGTSSLSRIVISLQEPLGYQLESQGTQLVVLVDKGAATFSETQNVEQPLEAVEAVPQEGAIGEAPLEPEMAMDVPAEDAFAAEAPLEETPAEPLPVVDSTEAELAATELNDVQFESSADGTVIRLMGNGAISDYEDFILEDPSRLVVDLKGIQNHYAGGTDIPLDTPEIKQIRLGETEGQLRVVFDLSHSAAPPYTIDRQGNVLVLTVVAAAPAPAFAEEQPLAPLEAEEPMPAQEEPFEAPMAEAEMAAPVEEPLPIEAGPVEEVAAPIMGEPISISGVGFKQLKDQNQSRVIIRANQPGFEYSTRDEPGKVIITVPNARLESQILRREFDTREFQTAITSITPKSMNGDTEFELDLEQQVAYAVSQDGNALYVDVEIPSEILRKQTDAVDGTPKLSSAAESVAQGEEILLEESPVVSESAPVVAEASAPKKNYKYVQEGFMSDTGGSGEPLSDMAAILAGEYRGKRFMGRKISLDFKDAEIRSIFRLLADISKLNLIISDNVKGRVTVRLNNVPWDQAFAIILQTKGLWFEKYGNIVRIAPAEKLRQERELAAAAARAAQAAKPLDVLFKPVSYATASSLMNQVRSVLTDRGAVDVDTRTNTLIIKDVREALEKAKKMVEILDTQTPQVSIESRIVEASTNYTRSFGIVWGGQANFSSATGNPTGVFFPNSATASGLGLDQSAITPSFSGLPIALNYPSPLGVNAGVGLRLGSINNVVDLDLALGLLESQGHAKLISSPKITVLDNSSATISAGTKIPFITQTANAGSSVRFENAMTSLNVTPHITNDGAISMQIAATRNEPNFSQLVQGNPVVDQRQANTEVLVKSGNTTVLGGIYSIRTSKVKDSLPGVSNIPIVGWLFRNYSKELRRTELLIFVTPRIVGDERESVRDIRG